VVLFLLCVCISGKIVSGMKESIMLTPGHVYKLPNIFVYKIRYFKVRVANLSE
jgi:hypothetical protein